MTPSERQELIDWAEDKQAINGLVLVKALWSSRSSLKFEEDKVYVPTVRAAMHAQPFTLALVLNPGTGYRDLSTGDWKGSDLKPGDVVVADQFVAFELETDNVKVNYLPESRVMAIVEGMDLEEFSRLL